MNGHFDGKKPLSELLVGVEYEFRAPKISPRGLVNNGNLCFANTILQCLVFSGPFWNLITLIKKFTVGDLKSKTPTVDAMCVQFFSPVARSLTNYSIGFYF